MTIKLQSSLGICVREANIEDDAHVIEDTLRRYLIPGADKERFNWLYTSGPHGSARAWLAVTSLGDVIGSAAAFPRKILIDGCEETAWVFGDFCLGERYRSLGPALQLQRACLKAADSAGVTFWYDFPSASMVAVYRRLGLSPSVKLLRMAKLLSVDRAVAKVVSSPFMRRAICRPVDRFLVLRDHLRGREWPARFSLHIEAFGEEFSRFANENRNLDGIVVRHDAEYLNWRYLRNPTYRYEVVVARTKGALVGYAIFFQTGGDATLVDLFSPGDVNILFGLLDWTVTYLRKRGVLVLSVPIVESHPFVGLLMNRGFMIRGSDAVVIQSGRSLRDEGEFQSKHRWLLMAGDRDS